MRSEYDSSSVMNLRATILALCCILILALVASTATLSTLTEVSTSWAGREPILLGEVQKVVNDSTLDLNPKQLATEDENKVAQEIKNHAKLEVTFWDQVKQVKTHCPHYDLQEEAFKLNNADDELSMRLRQFVGECGSSPRAKTYPKTVVVLLSGIDFRPRFEEAIITWTTFQSGVLAIVSFDQETHEFFTQRSIPSIFYDIRLAKGVVEMSAREKIMRTRFHTTLGLMLAGFRVLMSEMDIFCRKSPMDLDDPSADFLPTQHTYTREINTGMYFAHPTCATLRAFSKSLAWAESLNRTGAYCRPYAWEQLVLDHAVRGTSDFDKSKSCSGFPKYLLFDEHSKDIKLKYISERFVNHANWGGLRVNDTNVSCYHIWSHAGSISYRLWLGLSQGWYAPQAKQAALEGLAMIRISDKERRKRIP